MYKAIQNQQCVFDSLMWNPCRVSNVSLAVWGTSDNSPFNQGENEEATALYFNVTFTTNTQQAFQQHIKSIQLPYSASKLFILQYYNPGRVT